MPANPLRRRSKLGDMAKLAAADAALHYAKDRFTPGSRKQRGRGKALLVGGAVVAVGVAALANRKRVAGLLGAGPGVAEPPQPFSPPQPAYAPPAPVEQPVTQTEVAQAAATQPAEPQVAAADEPGPEPADQIPGQTQFGEPTFVPGDAGVAAVEDAQAPEAPATETASTPETPAAGDPAEREAAQRDEGQAGQQTPPESSANGEGKPDQGGGWQSWSGISSRP